MNLEHLKLNKPGQRYRDFELTKAMEIPELQCQLREFIHLPTGAEVMHISNDDTENVFCLSFRTLPEKSNGVAHILEHTVLCGSKKYPIKDPFFSMSRRSLNTFMNALTGPDFTCYPAATQVSKDFYNILEVYLDAVFHPILSNLSFLQEGHRLEYSIPNDPTSSLEHKGIVYNEMLGDLATGRARLNEAMMEALFSSVSYGVNSGGDPKEIVTLTYEELLDFHEKNYHPGRCLFYFYGNMPVEQHLDFIAENALKGVKPIGPMPKIPLQPRHSEPKRIAKNYPIAPDEDATGKTFLGFGWLTAHILEQEELLALAILAIILLDTDGSILKKALLKSGYCKQVSAYLEGEINEAPFTITLSGCEPKHVDVLEELIFETLKKVAFDGIPLEKIENAIHQFEFYRSEISSDHEPFGLALFMRSGLLKQHGARPEDGLTIHYLLDKIRQSNLQNPSYFSDLIEKHLVKNPHFVRIMMTPDPHLSAIEKEEEKLNLKKIQENITPEQKKQILKQAADLEAYQKEQQEVDANILPKIHLKDVPKAVVEIELHRETVGILDVYHHACFTNDIVYQHLTYDLPDVTEEELPFVRLFTMLAPQVGAGGRNYVENLEYIQAHTGGIGMLLNLNIHANDFNQFSPTLTIRGKALRRKTEKLSKLMFDTVTSLDFRDTNRLKELIHKYYVSLQGTLNSKAMNYAINLSGSGLDIPTKIANSWYGLDYFLTIKDLAENFDERAEKLVARLELLQEKLLGLQDPHLIITCNAQTYDEMRSHQFYDLSQLPTKSFTPLKANFKLTPVVNQARVISSPVAFSGKVFKTVPYIDEASPAISIAAYLCDNVVLHSKLREQGGAYGGGAVSNTLSGNFYFYSFRDPNIASTLKAFDEAVETLVGGDFDNDDLDEAKLEMIQRSDMPIAPEYKGFEAYSMLREKKTTEFRQTQRERMLGLTRKQVIEVVKAHILPNMNKGAAVVFAPKHLIDAENEVLKKSGKPEFPIFKI